MRAATLVYEREDVEVNEPSSPAPGTIDKGAVWSWLMTAPLSEIDRALEKTGKGTSTSKPVRAVIESTRAHRQTTCPRNVQRTLDAAWVLR